MEHGVRYAYVGNVHDPEADSTYCPGCGKRVIERDWYELGEWLLRDGGHCAVHPRHAQVRRVAVGECAASHQGRHHGDADTDRGLSS